MARTRDAFFDGLLSMGQRAETIMRFVRQAFHVHSSAVSAIGAMRRLGHNSSHFHIQLQQLQYSAVTLNDLHRQLASKNDLPTIPEAVTWAIGIEDVESINTDFLDAIEPLFEGHTVGEYRLRALKRPAGVGDLPPVKELSEHDISASAG